MVRELVDCQGYKTLVRVVRLSCRDALPGELQVGKRHLPVLGDLDGWLIAGGQIEPVQRDPMALPGNFQLSHFQAYPCMFYQMWITSS